MKNKLPTQKSFNLLKKGTSDKTFTDKLYDWSINVGRYIVIATEIVVLVTFGVRFFLDQNVNDLTDKVNTANQTYKALYQKTEKQTNNISKLIAFAKLTSDAQVPASKILNDIITAIPANLNITTIDQTANIITISGLTNSADSVTAFRINLQKTYSEVLTPETTTSDQNTKFTLKFKYAASI